jgi:hypothetical protein
MVVMFLSLEHGDGDLVGFSLFPDFYAECYFSNCKKPIFLDVVA